MVILTTMKETMINIGQAKSRLSEYARRVKNGERFILCDRNKPFAELRPLQVGGQRPFGLARGRIRLPEDFNAPDPEIERLFAGMGRR
jgi:antitoxin (DNA-binding transcriptional repressor) of toxin-antitoxin stability system